jgi:NhaC family Na+:H+ antiporter
MAVSFRRMPAIPGIAIGALAGAVFAVLLQGAGYEQIVSAAFSGYTADTGLEDVDSLLTRGGLESMFYTLSLIIVAMMVGAVMERTGQLRVVANRVLAMANSTGSLVLSTVLTAIGANLLLCDQYMAIVVSGRMYAEAYRERGLHPKNLSRAVEDSATVTANLVPWNSGGAYQAATLGVATIAYLPFNFFCWLSPLVTVLFAVFGITMHKRDQGAEAEEAPAKSAASEAD